MLIISGAINLFAVIFLKEQGIRIETILAALCNIVAFAVLGSYASILGEVSCGIVGIISFWADCIAKNKLQEGRK